MKRVWVSLAFLAAVGMLSLSTSALAKKGKLGGLYQAAINHHFAPVPKTGQTDLFTTGDDGDLEKGIPWPQPRFTDKGDGTVTDNLTGLIWMKNANAFDVRTWGEAMNIANNLHAGYGDLIDGSNPGDWRLPNVQELQSLVDYGRYDPCLPAGNPFINTDVQSGEFSNYWSSTTFPGNTTDAWAVRFGDGTVSHGSKGYLNYVWCVRGGN